MNQYDANTYDNRGFNALDQSDNFDAYMEAATDHGGAWDYSNPDNAADAITDYEYKALKADMGLFMSLYFKGEYRQASDLIAGIVTRYCDKQARDDFEAPEID